MNFVTATGWANLYLKFVVHGYIAFLDETSKYRALDTNQRVAHVSSIAHPDFQGKNRFSLLTSLRRTLLTRRICRGGESY